MKARQHARLILLEVGGKMRCCLLFFFFSSIILHCHCWCTEVIDEEINDQKSVSVHPLGDGKTLRFFLGGHDFQRSPRPRRGQDCSIQAGCLALFSIR
eukprot:scaffold26193_cov153-Skeletonema_marinoi.AAC.1